MSEAQRAGPPLSRPLTEVTAHRISPDDTVRLAVLSGPEQGSPTTVVFEVWEPGGAQPPNSHPVSTETFVVLAGHGVAHSDEHTRAIGPGDVLVLPPGSVHRIVNPSTTDRLYTITVMAPDDGFAALVERGPLAPLDPEDLAVLRGQRR
ncbi:cupin domain-containing protein [Frankia sp. AgB1.9]|uniref:cupin domain-containing protein n=1 Tax=unclassified Frankia TaxID=2632575 RepID=UPI001931D26F|nr:MULTISPECIES: cupin domain-containing protein [unclassified Frankia]MBL7489824.1 cupin domain-containing protein [Frankia sp. AgW1.1]MBL7548190.1 cupin domain-containing protein [Frankia sp. AgB1.9]MBL7623795.1 cupin domain-containing protein [Frankia sp. AgB1.8]